MIHFLELDDLLETHAFQIATYGGDTGLRDRNLLESAIAQPQATFGGNYLHTDLCSMAIDEHVVKQRFHVQTKIPYKQRFQESLPQNVKSKNPDTLVSFPRRRSVVEPFSS